MTTIDTDILVSGGGVAGLAAAAVFGAAGFSVLCVDPVPPVTAEDESGADLRTTAFLQPAKALLDEAGLWRRLAPHAAGLFTMRIVDAGGPTGEARQIADFEARELSDAPFGWNLPNWLLRREMLAHLTATPGVEFRPGIATARLTTRASEALATLSDGSRVRARLIVAADGRHSPLRGQLGIGASTWRYGQKALVCSLTHGEPHDNVSTEIHRTGGPFTLVPLPDFEGRPRSAVVWMDRGPEVAALMKMDKDAFEAALLERSAGLFGPLRLVSRRAVFPIITQHAHRMAGERVALMAEAAHVVPPIGAQGLNMSLADLRLLRDLAVEGREGLGAAAMLARYERRRLPEVAARVRAIDMLNRASMASAPTLRDLRRAGLRSIHGMAFVRRSLMRAGLGAT